MNDLRTASKQALEALESVLCDPEGKCCIDGSDADRAVVDKALAALRAALAQQAEPEACSNTFGCRCPKHFAVEQAEPVEPVAWVGDPSTQDYASTVPDPQVEDRLARHGIPMPEGDPK